MKGSNRLTFEDDLAASIRRRREAPREHSGSILGTLAMLVMAGVVLTLGWGGVRFAYAYFPFRGNQALAKTAVTVLEALKTNRFDALDGICADGTKGAALLQEDNQRVFKKEAQPNKTARLACLEFLRAVRPSLTEKGVAWDTVKPLLFAGLQAKVEDANFMQNAVVAVTGAVYFASGDAVYALEFSARRCKNVYVITDLWKCEAVEASRAHLDEAARQRLESWEREPGGPVALSKIKDARQILVAL